MGKTSCTQILSNIPRRGQDDDVASDGQKQDELSRICDLPGAGTGSIS